MTATRRRLLHRRVAETLVMRTTARGTILPLASQIAQHFQLAGLDTQAGEHYELAGEYARRLFANAEAIAHFRAALALGHPRPETLHTAIGDLQTLRGDYAAALASYETAAALSQQDDLPALEHTLGRLYHRLGDWSQAADHYQSSVSALSARDEPGLRVRDYADWSLTAYRQGDPEGARALATDALALATSMDDQYAIAQSLNILGILHRHAGDLSTARWHLAESVRLATELDDYALRAASLNNLALICFAQGAAAEAIDLASAALELCLVQGDRHREAAVLSNLADFHQFSGHPAEAMDYLTRSVSIYAEIGVVDGEHQPEVWKLVEW
jgi:tetratricopeptide (TPR) repeat protein